MPRPMCLTREKVSAPRSVSSPILGSSSSRKNCRAGSSRVRIRRLSRYRQLDAGDQRDDKRDGRGQPTSAAASCGHPFDEPGRQPQPLAPANFGACHSAFISIMIHSGQVQQAVQHQDAQFVLDAVAQFGGLRGRAVERDRNIVRAETTARPWRSSCRETSGSASAIPHPTQSNMSRFVPAESPAPDLSGTGADLVVPREAMGGEIAPTLSV